MLQEPHPFFTIGHSTRPFATFVDLLRGEGIRLVVDVRTVPRSRRNPQYNGDALAESLAPYDIAREHIAALGGLRGRQSGVPPNITFSPVALLKPDPRKMTSVLVFGNST